MDVRVGPEKAEHWRIDAFELWCWRRRLRVPWTARRSNQLILKEICPEYSLEGLLLKPKLQYFGHLMWKADSLEKTLKLGKTEGRSRRGRQRMRWLGGHWLNAHESEQTGPSLVAQLVQNLPAMQETWVLFLDWEHPLEKGKATHSSILAWRIPWVV